MRLYLAGPMTGIPQFNFPAFEAAAVRLRNAGYEVVSPHETDHPKVQKAAWASRSGDVADLPRGLGGSDLLLTCHQNLEDVASCGGVALLPNWEESKGVRFEIATADRFGIPVSPVGYWAYRVRA